MSSYGNLFTHISFWIFLFVVFCIAAWLGNGPVYSLIGFYPIWLGRIHIIGVPMMFLTSLILYSRHWIQRIESHERGEHEPGTCQPTRKWASIAMTVCFILLGLFSGNGAGF